MLQQAVTKAVGFLLLAIAPALAQSAIFPDKIGDFEKGAPKSLSLPDKALFDEFGLEATEQAEYKLEKKHFTATAWRFHDSTGAMAFYEARRPSGAKRSTISKLAVNTDDGEIFGYGNYVFQLTGAVPPAADFEPMYAHLPKLENSPLPVLMTYLPADGLIPNSERYVLGPVALERFEPQIPAATAAFHLGAEAQLGKYKNPKGLLNLAIFNYPTPNMAREQLAEFQKIPGAMARRVGPLVAVTIEPPDLNAAERLLSEVHYETNMTLPQKVPINEVKSFARTLLNAFILIGVVGAMGVVAGIAFGGYKILARKMGRKVEPDAMITLGLDGK